MADRQQFVSAYTKVLTQAWSDPSYEEQLESNPKQALQDAGLDTGDASVQVVSSTEGSGDLDQQVQLFEQGLESGTIKLYVPKSPPVDAEELRDVDLEATAQSGDTTSYCCCCCPCCTCT